MLLLREPTWAAAAAAAGGGGKNRKWKFHLWLLLFASKKKGKIITAQTKGKDRRDVYKLYQVFILCCWVRSWENRRVVIPAAQRSPFCSLLLCFALLCEEEEDDDEREENEIKEWKNWPNFYSRQLPPPPPLLLHAAFKTQQEMLKCVAAMLQTAVLNRTFKEKGRHLYPPSTYRCCCCPMVPTIYTFAKRQVSRVFPFAVCGQNQDEAPVSFKLRSQPQRKRK